MRERGKRMEREESRSEGGRVGADREGGRVLEAGREERRRERREGSGGRERQKEGE